MSANGILAQSQMLIDDEQYDKAYEMLEKSYDKLKEEPEYLEKIALLAKTLEKTEDAKKYWEELAQINPQSVLAYSELLDFYANTDKYKYYITRAKYKILNGKVSQSIDDYKKAIGTTNEEEDLVNARFLLAKAYEHENKIQEAIDEYHRILEHKDDMAIYYRLADLYCEQGNRFSAISVLEQGVKAFPDIIELNEYLSGLYIKEGQFDKALQYAKTDFTKIKTYLMKGENQVAFDMLEKVEDTQNANYPALMAEYYFNMKDYDKCSEWIDKFNELSPQNPLVYQMRALICDAKKDDYGYHYNMGKCYSYNQNYELALAEYLNAHRYDDKQPEAIKEIIKINEATGDKTSLMEFYEKLVRQEPENTFALKGLGDIYADMYEFKDALNYYKKISQLEPNNYEIYQTIGYCYEKLKNTAAAKESYEKYLSKAPLSPDTEKLKEKIEKMSASSPSEPDSEQEGFIDKIMRIFGK